MENEYFDFDYEEGRTFFQKHLELLKSSYRGTKSFWELWETDTEIRHIFLAKCANEGRFDVLFDGMKFIDMFKPIADGFSRLSFHEWLLINPKKEAFELWKALRERKEKASNKNYISGFNNSAALIIYANLPERLKHLKHSDWMGSCRAYDLYEGGFKIKIEADIPEERKARILESLFPTGKFEEQDKLKLNALDLACLHGSKNLIEESLKAEKKSSKKTLFFRVQWDKRKILNSLNYYMMLGNFMPTEPLVDVLNKTNSWSDERMRSAFTDAFKYYNLEKLKEIWSQMDEKTRSDFIQIPCGLPSAKRKCIFNEKTDLFDFVFLLEDAVSPEKDVLLDGVLLRDSKLGESISDNTFRHCIEKNKVKSVNYLLTIDSSLLEKDIDIFDELFKNDFDDPDCSHTFEGLPLKGTALMLATLLDQKDMIDLLLRKGASTKPLSELMSLKQFKKSSRYAEISPHIERSLLSGAVRGNSNAPETRKRPDITDAL